jgi:hypothetical protein
MTKVGFAENGEVKDTPTKPKAGLEIGDSGTRIFSGVIQEEYNRQLDGLRGINVYEEMRKSDSTVAAILKAVKLPIRSAEWRVKPASEDARDVEIAEFVHANLFDILKWADFLRHTLLAFDFGFMVFEKVFEARKVNGKDRIVWGKLAPRLPRSIVQWEIAGKKLGVVQQTADGRSVDIPMEKLVVFVNDKEGDNWQGVSLLRTAYKPWYMKTTLEKVDAIAHERQGLGVPYAKMPEGEDSQAARTKAETILKNMRANEHAFVIIPDGYEIGFMDMKASTTRDPSNSLAYHSREIMKSVLAQFLELGSTSGGGTGGSRALSQDHSALFLQSEETAARWICDTMKDPIKELVDFNFPGVEKYPELDFEGITREDVAALVSAYGSLKNSGAITAQDADEASFREKLGLPELDETGIREEEPEEPEPFSEHHRHLKKNFAEGFKPSRPLTFAEQKVDFDGLHDRMNDLEATLDKSTKELLHDARNKYMAALTRAAHKGDTAAIKEATLKIKAEYARILKASMKSAFEFGKTNAAKEIRKNAPANPQYILDQIDIQADAIADDHITAIVADSKNSYTNAINRGSSVTAALAAADLSAEEAIDTLTTKTREILTSGYINNGRDEIFDRYDADVHALQRSELLDPVTCNFCLSLDGRVVENADNIARTGPVHSNCRGIWVAIMKDEAELPKISGVPKTIRDRLGDEVNDVVQPKKPITKKDSAARKEADKRPE